VNIGAAYVFSKNGFATTLLPSAGVLDAVVSKKDRSASGVRSAHDYLPKVRQSH
jgi:hypothetical protein